MTDTLKDEIIALTVEAVEKAYQMGLMAGTKAEREACASVCDAYSATTNIGEFGRGWICCAKNTAATIRARTKGETNT